MSTCVFLSRGVPVEGCLVLTLDGPGLMMRLSLYVQSVDTEYVRNFEIISSRVTLGSLWDHSGITPTCGCPRKSRLCVYITIIVINKIDPNNIADTQNTSQADKHMSLHAPHLRVVWS